MTGFVTANSAWILIKLLSDLFTNYAKTKRDDSLKFLGVMIDENLTWKTHVELVENKSSKSVRIIFETNCSLNSKISVKYVF